jgi:hypothetical protein
VASSAYGLHQSASKFTTSQPGGSGQGKKKVLTLLNRAQLRAAKKERADKKRHYEER